MGRIKNAFKVMLGVAAVAVTLLTGTKEVKAEEPNWFYVELAEGCSAAKVNARGLGSEYEYSFDLRNWEEVPNYDDISLSTPSNTKVYIRPESGQEYQIIPGSSSQGGGRFKIEGGLVRIGGDILTLLSRDPSQAQMESNAFKELFFGCSCIVDASQLKLPNYVKPGCYKNMFQSCTSLKSAPNLPATELEEACYQAMFYYCINLTTAPNLPATTLAEKCYELMFSGCENLNEVHVGLTSIEFDYVENHPMYKWLEGTAQPGTLYCTQDLFNETKDEMERPGGAQPHDYLHYPDGWTYAVDKPAPEPSPEPSPQPSPQPSPKPSPEPSPKPSPEPSPKPSPEPKFEDPTETFGDVPKGKWYSKVDGPIAYVVAY